MKLQNVTVGKKLFASFAFVVLMLLVITAFSFFVIGKLEEFRRDVRNLTTAQEEIEVKRDLQLQAANVWQFMTDASLTRDKKVIAEKAKPSFDSALMDIEKLMAMNRNKTEQLGKLEGLKKDLSGMWDTGNSVSNAYLVNGSNGNALMGEYDRISAKVIKDTADLAEEQAKNVRNDAKNISSKVGRVLHLISVMIIALAVLGLLFAAFLMMLRKSILKQPD